MTEKVRAALAPIHPHGDIDILHAALPRLAPLEHRPPRRRRGLARVLRPHLGFVQQHRADVRPLCLEVRHLPSLRSRPLTDGPDSWDLHVTSSCHRIKIYSVNTARPETRRRIALMRAHGIESFEPLSRPLPFALEDEKKYLETVRKYPREPKS